MGKSKENESLNLLERLINSHGVSGNEKEVREIIIEAIEPYVDDINVDSTGNVIAHKKGKEPEFMLAAHMDEIGMMVREITTDGLLLCAAVGGIIPVSMIGTRVTVQGENELIHGIVTTREISCGEDTEEPPYIDDLVVDTGLTLEKLREHGVTVGAFLEPRKEVNWLTFGNTISGKALDDRIGCYCLIEIARQLRKVDQEVYFVFTVQEEVSVQGAKTSAFAIHPRWAIVIDVTVANDLSSYDEKTAGTNLTLGKGPCILHMEEGFIPNAELVHAIRKTAEENNIPIQHEVSSFGTTDASNISAVRRGVPSANVSIAIRNVHSTIEIANRKDVENTIALVCKFLKHVPATLQTPHTHAKEETAVIRRAHKPPTKKIKKATKSKPAKKTKTVKCKPKKKKAVKSKTKKKKK